MGVGGLPYCCASIGPWLIMVDGYVCTEYVCSYVCTDYVCMYGLCMYMYVRNKWHDSYVCPCARVLETMYSV